ncbi:MAG: DUF2069 domain-containing protein [Oleiphilaceae bacterium]|nr:DUF2069 domain-containing protein [Oleiphilaceae bacterium]
MTQRASLTRRSLGAQQITWFSYALLLLLMVITSLPGTIPEGSSSVLILSIKLLPLLIVLPGIISGTLRAYIWLCFIVLFYFTQAVVESFLSAGAGLDLLITLLTVVMFCSAMLYVKWQRALGKSL